MIPVGSRVWLTFDCTHGRVVGAYGPCGWNDYLYAVEPESGGPAIRVKGSMMELAPLPRPSGVRLVCVDGERIGQ